jgi:hypothetical protein
MVDAQAAVHRGVGPVGVVRHPALCRTAVSFELSESGGITPDQSVSSSPCQ